MTSGASARYVRNFQSDDRWNTLMDFKRSIFGE